MPAHPLLLLLFLPLLIFIPWSSGCRTASYTECQQAPFVPGHNLVGEGFDIVKMQTSGATVVDMMTFMVGNGDGGNCTLCPNALLKQDQKLPVSVRDWRLKVLCGRSLSSKKYESSTSLLKESTGSTSNSWKIGLGLKDVGGAQVGGTKSETSKFVQDRSTKDKYSFISDAFKCQYYTFRLHSQPSLTKEFEESLKKLPTTYCKNSSAYHHFLSLYGTHFIRRVHLGGRVHSTTAIRTCQEALNGLSINSISDCLSVEASATIEGNKIIPVEKKYCKDLSKKLQTGKSFSATFTDRITEVLGGDSQVEDLLFSPGNNSKYKAWLKSLKKLPGLVSYQLSSLHMLVRNNPELKNNLRNAISYYINTNTVSLACPSACTIGRHNTNCVCKCSGHDNVDGNCCSNKLGVAMMSVTVIRAVGLYGDTHSKTDSYVKVSYGNDKQITGVIMDNDFPVWNLTIDYGTVNLQNRTTLEFEVWDRDRIWDDDLLGTASIIPTKGQNIKKTLPLKHGTLHVSLSVVCGPSLTGSLCSEYAPTVNASGLRYVGAWRKDSETPILLQGPHTVHNNKFL